MRFFRLLTQRTVLAGALIGLAGLSSSAYSATACFATDPTVSCTGTAVSTGNAGLDTNATATFTTGTNSITVTLANLFVNPESVSQLVSDVFFTVSGTATGGGQQTANASMVNVAGNGTASFTSGTTTWLLSNVGNMFHLDVLGSGSSGPENLIIGPPGPGGTYSNANGSIAGNDPHNPFINQTVTFTLALAGVTAATTITDVAISFGTTPSTIPIPAAVWLFASGLIGLIGIARRKRASGNLMPAMA